MAKVAELQVKGMPPDAMGMAIVKAMAEIALDEREPKQLRIQAGSAVLPYCLPRLSVVDKTVTHRTDFSDCRTIEELNARVVEELGPRALQALQTALGVAEDDVIDAEVIEPEPAAEQQAELAKAEP
jgi:hypothetical protein